MSARWIAALAVAFAIAAVLASRQTTRARVFATTAADAAATPSSSAPSATAFYARKRPPVGALTELGRTLFADRTLSAGRDRACETCHAPSLAYGPPKDAPIGRRAIPSLRYLQTVPRFSLHHIEEDGIDQGPTGGFMWDGRAATAHDQARLPLLSEAEMGNVTESALATRTRASTSASALTGVFGPAIFDSDEETIAAVLLALEVFEQSPADFAPYDSKYDAWLRGQTKLSPAEERGRVLFDAEAKGNCASCHVSHIKEGSFPAFSDWGFVALAVPLRPGDPPDRGLCERPGLGLETDAKLCNLFRTPSLRNVTKRDRFFHNGFLTSLVEVVRFYATRDVKPERYNVDRTNANTDPPFGRSKPPLTESEIADVVAFLGTLADGWTPTAP